MQIYNFQEVFFSFDDFSDVPELPEVLIHNFSDVPEVQLYDFQEVLFF